MRWFHLVVLLLVLAALGAEEYTVNFGQGSIREVLPFDKGGEGNPETDFRPQPGHDLAAKVNVAPAAWRYLIVSAPPDASRMPPPMTVELPTMPFAEEAGEKATDTLTWSGVAPVEGKVPLAPEQLPADAHLVAVTWLDSPIDGEYWVAIGCRSRSARLQVNDKFAWSTEVRVCPPHRADEWIAPLDFKTGRNRVVLVAKLDPGKPIVFSLIALLALDKE